jgi:mannose-6-phosphate isomerase-like protein (cupin superfamily)
MSPKPFVVAESHCELEQWADPVRGFVKWRTLLSADRTPSKSLVVGVAELSERSGSQISLHRHAETEVYYVLSGEGVISIDGVEQPLSSGDTVFIPGGTLHGARCRGTLPLRILYVFSADSFSQIVYEFPDAGRSSRSDKA